MRFYPCLLSTALLFPFRNCMRSPCRSDRGKSLRDAGVIEYLGAPDLNKAAGSKAPGFFLCNTPVLQPYFQQIQRVTDMSKQSL